MRKNLAKWLQHRFCKESVAFTFCTSCDLAIGDLASGCLGVHAIESLDVRVATNFCEDDEDDESCEKLSCPILTHPL